MLWMGEQWLWVCVLVIIFLYINVLKIEMGGKLFELNFKMQWKPEIQRIDLNP